MLSRKLKVLMAPDPIPVFFVSVASKGLRQTVSLLFAILAGGSISAAAKGLGAFAGWKTGRLECWNAEEREVESQKLKVQRGSLKRQGADETGLRGLPEMSSINHEPC